MDITKTTKHMVKFAVEQFVGTEGGMDHDQFGKEVDSLSEAIHLLEVARAHDENQSEQHNWIITAYVTTKVS